MKIDRSQIVDLLRSRGENDKAAQAERDLPMTVDTDDHKDLLARFDLDDQAIRGALADRPGGVLGTGLGLGAAPLGDVGSRVGVDEPTEP